MSEKPASAKRPARKAAVPEETHAAAPKEAPAAPPVPTPPPAPAPEAVAPEEPAPTGLRIVVAEDEALIRLDLAEMLAELGYEVVGQASDGEQAVALVKEHRPDVVIMDVKMPVLDGISAAEAIGKDRIAPVIMLTAVSQKELVERARDAGVMAYIVKPFTQADLAPAVDIATSRWAELKALEGEIADLGERLETRKAVDRAKGILMQRLKLSEADAFRWIQKTAMDRRLGMREVADAVITQMPATT
jgi:two-component system, response regulator PdtaR